METCPWDSAIGRFSLGQWAATPSMTPCRRPFFPLSLESGIVTGVLSGTNISEGWDGQLLEGYGTLSFAGQGQDIPLQIDVEYWSIALVPSPGVGLGLLLGGSRLNRRRRTS